MDITAITSRLKPKTIALLVAFALLLIAIVMGSALYGGAEVDIWGLKIGSCNCPEPQEKIHVRLKIDFDPNRVNIRSPKLEVKAFVKSEAGNEIAIPVLSTVEVGGFYVEVDINIKTPFFIVVKTGPDEVWKTDDYSITKAYLTAYPNLIINN